MPGSRWLVLLAATCLAATCLGGAITATAQSLSRSVSDDGLPRVLAYPQSGRMLPSHPGTGRPAAATGGAGQAEFGARAETAQEVWALWALQGVEPPVGRQSIIGPDERIRVRETTAFPFRATVLITFGAGRCSGWLISPDTVVTSGHCVHSGGPWGDWYDRNSYMIYPGRDGPRAPFGSCSARRLFSVVGWTERGRDDFDYGAIKLNCTIGFSTGWFGLFTASGSLQGVPTRIAGYPGDKPLTLWRSSGRVTVSQPRRVFYRNDTVGGMSGSPVYYQRAGCGFCAMAVHGYGIYGRPPFSTNNHGTRITAQVFRNLDAWRLNP
ncbi:V8-like Glu-specific endopeptidase [Tepidamorphus gemmatus]|uniref:Serine protease n=1 Tax=Tepidamorphus gemmatus TaxID=747076 RepID=A0A4R3MJG8_9HYPH|nr:trypsin-like peptidase domain-containing protein [Tepidamorphus gemmatus]TCT13554.1 V8-like Glu-specific endopeptidase [Tepidamorphus gemmatus]